MKIERTFTDAYYPISSRILGNCYNVLDKDKTYHYEFIIKKNKAKIKTDNLTYIEEVTDAFHKINSYIAYYSTEDNAFYKSFDEKFIFKLPLSILQVSTFFLNQDKITQMEEFFPLEELFLPVCIYNDEYVLIDGHHRAYLAYQNLDKMVNVYLDEPQPKTTDFVYIAKEQNIRQIKDLKLLSQEDYEALWSSFQLLYPED